MYSPFPSDAIDLPNETVDGGHETARKGGHSVSYGEPHAGEMRDEDVRSGASLVKNGPKKLVSVTFPTQGLLSDSRRPDTPNTSESEPYSPIARLGTCPVRLRKLIPLFHSSVVRLW